MDFKCKTYACDEIITINNVKELSEYLTVNCVKSFMRFSRVDFFFNLYDNLFRDIRCKNDYRYIFSSAYDIVMDAYCFLFSHLGKRLNDITKVSKYGVLKEMTILGGCMFILSKHIRQDLFTYNCKDIDICRKSELRINDNYDYSEEFGYNADYFSHVFKETFGISPQRYVINKRVSTAKHLLLTTDKPVGEVALLCGFSDPLYFARIFSKEIGVAPSVFRQSFKHGK